MTTEYKDMLHNAMRREEEETKMAEEKFDLVGFIMAYEDGTLDDDAAIEGFQYLIDTGMAWTLQGHYGRTAAALIEAGYCVDPKAAIDPEQIAFEEAERNGY